MVFMDHDLEDVKKELQEHLDRNDISRFIDPDKITSWLEQNDTETSRFILAMNMLSGLLPEETIEDIDKTKGLMDSLKNISDAIHKDTLDSIEKNGKPKNVRIFENKVPPLDWTDIYEEAFFLTNERDFIDASEKYDETFQMLLRESTTNREPFRIFYNASTAYLFGGRPELGTLCLDYSLALNPNYPLARERMIDIRSKRLEPMIATGVLRKNISELAEETVYSKCMDIKSIPAWFLIIGLKTVGVDINKQDLLNWTVDHNNIGEMIDKEVKYKHEKDRDFIELSLFGLWNRYCPDEPCHDMIEDVLWKIDDHLPIPAEKEDLIGLIELLERLIFSEKDGFLNDLPSYKGYDGFCQESLMDLFMYISNQDDLKERGMKIAEELQKGTGDKIWSVPIQFFNENDIEKLKEIRNSLDGDDPKDEEIKDWFDDFLAYRMEEYDLEFDNMEEDLDIFDDVDEDDEYLIDHLDDEMMENFREFMEDDLPEPGRNYSIMFHPASVYFRYLKGLGLNFETGTDVESEKRILKLESRKKKIGRNEPCPCGSGKKYKKCCLQS